MDGIDLLLGRVSSPVLATPGPTDEQLGLLFSAALRAPDHARLRPWRFLTVSGEARELLGELMAKAAHEEQPDLSREALDRFRGLPLRAPALILPLCRVQEHPKVPEIEQQLSVGAAVQSILMAAHVQGLGAIWRTGAVCYSPHMHSGLGLESNEQLLGFIYLGTPSGSKKKIPALEVSEYVSSWTG